MKLGWVLALYVGCGFNVPAGGDGGNPGGERTIDMASSAPSSPRKVTFNNANVTTQLDDFPVLVPIAGQVDYSKILDPRKDLRFEDPSNGATLAYEVETWTPNGESLVWVRVPRISPSPAPASILMYFGRDLSNAAPASVWSTYEQVNHFAANPDDSTAQNHDATLVIGATTAAGFLGNAMTFTGGGDRVVFSGRVFDQWGEGTIEMWIRPAYPGPGGVSGEPRVLSNGGALQLGRFYLDSTALVFQIDAKWSSKIHSEIHPDLPFNTWTHVAWSYDGQAWRSYRDGQLVQTDVLGNHNFVGSSAPLVLGDDFSSTTARMQIDELRISKSHRSADWLRTQQASMTRAFVSFSDP